MDKKILTVVGIIFALIFTASFLIIWNSAKTNIGYTVGEFNSTFSTLGGYEYDLSLLENAHVTSATQSRYTSYVNSGRDVIPSIVQDGWSITSTHKVVTFSYDKYGNIKGLKFDGN